MQGLHPSLGWSQAWPIPHVHCLPLPTSECRWCQLIASILSLLQRYQEKASAPRCPSGNTTACISESPQSYLKGRIRKQFLWGKFHAQSNTLNSTWGTGRSSDNRHVFILSGWPTFIFSMKAGREECWPNLLLENYREKRQRFLNEMDCDTHLTRTWVCWYPLWQSRNCYHLWRGYARNPKNWKSWGI